MRREMTKCLLVAGAAIAALVIAPSTSWSQSAPDSKSTKGAAKKSPSKSNESSKPNVPATPASKTSSKTSYKTSYKTSPNPTYGPTLSKSDRAPIDLFPRSVLSNLPQQPERSRGISLGDDGNWKVQAAQVGAMAIGFAALVGLCGSGNCKIPNSAANALLPSFLESETNIATPSPRRVQPIRKLR